jgi:hypothetical protein
MSRSSAVIGGLLSILWASTAYAHISLERGGTHKSRYGDDAGSIKGAPCGVAGGARGTNIYTYEPGQTITVKWVEYVAHPGYFRFAFDADGDSDFEDPASIMPVDPSRGCPATGLDPNAAMRDQCAKDDFYNTPAVLPNMDDLFPHADTPTNKLYSMDIKLPDVECDHCTLQLIQIMEDPIHGPYNLEVSGLGDADDVYHQCIDLVLKRGAIAAGIDSAAGSGAAGTGNLDAGSAGKTGSTSSNEKSSGCSIADPRGTSMPTTWLTLLPVFGWMLRRRRTRS